MGDKLQKTEIKEKNKMKLVKITCIYLCKKYNITILLQKIFYEADIISVWSIKDFFNGCIKFNFILLKK